MTLENSTKKKLIQVSSSLYSNQRKDKNLMLQGTSSGLDSSEHSELSELHCTREIKRMRSYIMSLLVKSSQRKIWLQQEEVKTAIVGDICHFIGIGLRENKLYFNCQNLSEGYVYVKSTTRTKKSWNKTSRAVWYILCSVL